MSRAKILFWIEGLIHLTDCALERAHNWTTSALAAEAKRKNAMACPDCAGTGKRWCDRSTCQCCDGYGSFDLAQAARERQYVGWMA